MYIFVYLHWKKSKKNYNKILMVRFWMAILWWLCSFFVPLSIFLIFFCTKYVLLLQQKKSFQMIVYTI